MNRLASAPGLRVLAKIGRDRLITLLAVTVCLQSIGVALFLWRPDLLRPGDIGTDASNYYAAAVRLLDGNPLYALSPGDRPVPADNPPLWSVPLLSPPPMAIIWLPIAAFVPGVVAMYMWWLAGLVGTLAVGLALALRTSPWVVMAGMVLAPAIAITAVSGNLNALIVPGLALVFALADQPRSTRLDLVLALLASTMAACKLGPILAIWWLLVLGRWRAAGLAVGVSGALVVASLGPGATTLSDYLAVAQQTAAAGATALSGTSILLSLGASTQLASAAPLLCLAVAAGLALVLRRRRLPAMLAIALGIIFATPVVRYESFALLSAALAAGGEVRPTRIVWSRLARPRSLSAVGLVTIAALALWIGSAPSSSFTVRSDWTEPVFVRFGAAWQGATFGYRIEPQVTVRAFGPVTGALTGDLVVFDQTCRTILSTLAPAAGGHIDIDRDGAARLTTTPHLSALPLARYDPSCAGQ